MPVLGQSPSTLKTMLSGAGPGQPEKKFEDFDKVAQVFSFNDDDKCVRVQEFHDRGTALKAAGLD